MTSTDLRHGPYADALADVRCDTVISDPPYGAKTHAGALADQRDNADRTPIDYAHWTAAYVEAFVDFWCARARSG